MLSSAGKRGKSLQAFSVQDLLKDVAEFSDTPVPVNISFSKQMKGISDRPSLAEVDQLFNCPQLYGSCAEEEQFDGLGLNADLAAAARRINAIGQGDPMS